MELYRIGPRLEEVQRPLAPEDRALVLLTSQELERPPQQAGPEDVLRHTPSAREALQTLAQDALERYQQPEG